MSFCAHQQRGMPMMQRRPRFRTFAQPACLHRPPVAQHQTERIHPQSPQRPNLEPLNGRLRAFIRPLTAPSTKKSKASWLHSGAATLGSVTSILLTPQEAIAVETNPWPTPGLDSPVAKVLDFEQTIPRSTDVVQYIVRSVDDERQNSALSDPSTSIAWGAATSAPALSASATAAQNSLWEAYCHALDTHPLPAKMATGVVGTVLGDSLAQFSAMRSRQQRRQQGTSVAVEMDGEGGYDWVRCGRQVLYSALIGTPLCHLWFGFLDMNIFPECPTSLHAVFSKVAMDQLLMAPFGTALFFVVMKLLEGAPADVQATLRTRYLPTLLASYMLWPLAHVVNFALVPSQQRILYVNCIAVLWTAYMSHMASDAGAAREEQPALSSRPPSAASPPAPAAAARAAMPRSVNIGEVIGGTVGTVMATVSSRRR